MDSSTYSQVSLGAGILSAAGEGGADNGRDGVLARGTGELSAGGLRDGGGDLADDALMRVLLDLECRRHGGWYGLCGQRCGLSNRLGRQHLLSEGETVNLECENQIGRNG